jgi:hypothetical protein
MFELYGDGGRRLYFSSSKSEIMDCFHRWPNAEYVIEIVERRNIIALKEEIAHAALEQETTTAVAGGGGVEKPF